MEDRNAALQQYAGSALPPQDEISPGIVFFS
jgi:hypothetical protein